jgi:hypothetical protein
MTNDTVEICSICAWRATCKKKFSVSGKDLRCVDFSRDITIKTDKEIDDEKKEEQEITEE